MIELILDTEKLIPTDSLRNPKTLLEVIPLYVHGKEEQIEPILVIPYRGSQEERYLICSGNHRAAAAYICRKPIKSKVLTEEGDLQEIREGPISEAKTLTEMHGSCVDEAEKHCYLDKGWQEYLRDLFGHSVVPDF